MGMTLRALFDVIAYGATALNPTTPLPMPSNLLAPPITHEHVVKFVKQAGVSDGLIIKSASLTAKGFMDTFGDGSGAVSWDRFQAKGLEMLPGAAKELTPESASAEIEKRWSEIDTQSKGAVSVGELKKFIEKTMSDRGVKFAGMKADVAAKLLMHALDVAPRDTLLQKEELKAFFVDAVNEAKAAAASKTGN